jgi:hypothetical protein
MPSSIDCSLMSHASCEATSGAPQEEPLPAAATAEHQENDALFASYDCLNDCVSSLGVVALVDGALSAVGCLALPPACPVLIGTSVGAVLGACDNACRELEQK